MEKQNTSKRDNLDLEFKKVLCIIRHHIPRINSNAYLLQCRIWLEKLSGMQENKQLRNMYLAELCKQIQVNRLLPPFNEAPPNGDLNQTKLYKRNLPPDQSTSLIRINISSNPNNLDMVEPLASDEESPHSNTSGLKSKIKKSKEIDTFQGDKNMCSGEPHEIKKQKKTKEAVIDDESWSDVTDSSCDLDLKHEGNGKTDLNQSRKVSNIVENVITEQEPNLKYLKETNSISNNISQDWKTTIAGLQLRLSEMIQQNTELNLMVQNLEAQLHEQKMKNKSQQGHNLKIFETLHSQEIVKLKELHATNIAELEKSFEANLTNLHVDHTEKIDYILSNHEEQIVELKKQQDEMIMKKDNEICKLSQVIQDQCLRIMNDISSLKTQVSNCSCEKKVHVLKKCVSKMDKLFQKSEKDYIKQIEQLRQDLELKENSLKVQLKMQKAELITQTRIGQKQEFEDILNSLEIKYIKMLEGHEQQIMKMKKLDDQKIEYLSELLEKHGIPYNGVIE